MENNIKGNIKFNFNIKTSNVTKINLDKEIWKETRFKNYYVSNYGRILSKGNTENRYKRNRDLILSSADNKNGNGYLFVNICRKQIYIHRLVAETFIPNPNNYPEVNHKNENKKDNRVDNLEWCDAKYNIAYSLGKKVKQIDVVTKEVINIFDSANQAAKFVNGKNGSILMCCNRIKYNTYKGYIWRFLDDNDYNINYKYNNKIVRINTNTNEEKIYNNVKDAAKDNKVSIDAIYNCLYKKSKTCAGYVWVKR